MAALTPRIGDTPEASLARYLREIRKFPMLEAQEEKRLAADWRYRDDQAAAAKMVNSHLRLVAKIAMGYRGYGLPLPDLISEGNVGMMQAVNRFDPDKGFRLSTYAIWWIRAAVQEYILHSWSMVKMGTTAAQRKLFFNLRKLKARLRSFEEGDLYPEHVSEIARRLGVREDEVVSMNRRMTGLDRSLNAPVNQEGSGQWQDWLPDESGSQEDTLAASQELDQRRRLLNYAIKELSGRERHIIEERRLKDAPTTLEVLSRHYGVSRERIRQIEIRAFEKIKKTIHKAAAAGPKEALFDGSLH